MKMIKPAKARNTDAAIPRTVKNRLLAESTWAFVIESTGVSPGLRVKITLPPAMEKS